MNDHAPGNQAAGFSESWLTLREPFDHEARCKSIDQKLYSLANQKLRILDLGCGTGSNLRYLLPRLGHDQHWTLVDNDQSLLAAITDNITRWAATQSMQVSTEGTRIHIQSDHFSASIDRIVCDIATQLTTLPFSNSDLITGSALLDLTSAAWLDQLAHHAIAENCAVFFVLNYSGKVQWQPPLEDDDLVLQQLNQHQRHDKGFGAALGPDAGFHFAKQLELQGREVLHSNSHWKVSANDAALQLALLEGWAPAAIEVAPHLCEQILDWQEKRVQQIRSQNSTLQVNHIDILSFP